MSNQCNRKATARDVLFSRRCSRRFFARHPVVLQIGSNLFVHGGLLPDHASLGLEHINRSVGCSVGALHI